MSAIQWFGPGWKTSPPFAASWWATKTTVSAPSGSPASATTFAVVRRGSSRRKTCGPPETSSAIAAAAPEPGGGREPARAAGEPGERADRRQECHRDRERAGRALLLDPGRRAEPLELAAQPFRGFALARARRRAVDRLQPLDDGAQAVLSGGIRRGTAQYGPRMRDPDCLFCKIVAGEIPSTRVREDERTIAFMDINPATRGHLLVVPREHAADLLEIGADDLAACAAAAQALARDVKDKLGADGVNLLNACGREAWQTVFHFHIHVIPRYVGDPLRLPWVPGPGDRDEIAAAAAALTG